ncbi:hypothetical protein QA640_04510 [Bradyrhizobium sp. CB82]|uniref:hypothetical protein n=1 Tax=Bradyrhizobium sp. CB82 TaxID=3039159 RepID=UPI0024B090BA|nr:hypothetical protein [Bradyrhizobium sp. CB82]WFU41782.1 hypothetical protein QA640_04510 [Bradyrhizobium sp. CB82]
MRAIAAWYAVGTDRRPSPFLEKRGGNPAALFDALRELGYPHTVVAISSEGFRKIGEVLCPFTAILSRDAGVTPAQLQSDDLPAEVNIRGVPGWVYDQYSAEGRRALQCYLKSDALGAKWVRQHVSPERRVRYLGDIVFRLEGGLVKNRLCWPTGALLRRMVDQECYSPPDIFELMLQDIPKLNEVRNYVC